MRKFVLAALFLLCGVVYAQSDRGTITGTISDPARAVVARAAAPDAVRAACFKKVRRPNESGGKAVMANPPKERGLQCGASSLKILFSGLPGQS